MGFDELPQQDREAIFHFALLWSLFEARALSTRAHASAILALVHEWAAQGILDARSFTSELEYFQHRYFLNGKPTKHFAGLYLRNNDCPDLVRRVLNGENVDPADSIAALLIVVYRLRNNLFHGVKWAYGIRGQLDNFTNANSALMNALNIVGPL